MTRPLRIGLLSEGETELGSSVPYVKPQDGGKVIQRSNEGALHTLIRRELALEGIAECEFIQRHPSMKEQRKSQIRVGYSVADRKYLQQTVVSWGPDKVDLVIIVIDSDDKIQERQEDINKALIVIRANHFRNDEETIPDQSAGGLAIKNFETWLLAGKPAFQDMLDVSIESFPDNLEDLPTNKDDPHFSKNLFDSALETSNFRIDLAQNKREMNARWELAKTIDLAQIKNKCPQGYHSFVNDLIPASKRSVETMAEQ